MLAFVLKTNFFNDKNHQKLFTLMCSFYQIQIFLLKKSCTAEFAGKGVEIENCEIDGRKYFSEFTSERKPGSHTPAPHSNACISCVVFSSRKTASE
jgi:hypothetical protein